MIVSVVVTIIFYAFLIIRVIKSKKDYEAASIYAIREKRAITALVLLDMGLVVSYLINFNLELFVIMYSVAAVFKVIYIFASIYNIIINYKACSKKTLRSIINKWDPVDLMPFAPKDEYDPEVKEIEKYIHEHKENITLDELTDKIYNVFVTFFGEFVFVKTKEDCADVAKKILKKIKS